MAQQVLCEGGLLPCRLRSVEVERSCIVLICICVCAVRTEQQCNPVLRDDLMFLREIAK